MKSLRKIFGTGSVVFSIVVAAYLFSASIAAAQEKPEEDISDEIVSEEKKAPEEYELETITVTVQKREENIQDVPASVTALSEIQIEDAGIGSTNEIDPFIPNFTTFSYGDTSFSYYSIRGLSNMVLHSRSVGIYIDDVPMMTDYVTDSGLYELERIEVLRGPQGNLYGLNTEGGVINIITKKPDNTWSANAIAVYGNYETQFYRASVSGPVIKDTLFFGLCGVYDKQGEGYIDSPGAGEEDDREMSAGRGQIRWTPNEKLDILFNLTGETRNDGMWRLVIKDDDPFDIPKKNVDEYSDSDIDTQSIRIKYTAPWFELTSISARYANEGDSLYSLDYSGMDLMKYKYLGDDTNLSQEIRLSSIESESPLNWLIGGSYFHRKLNYDLTMIYDGSLFDATGATPVGMMFIDDIYDTAIHTDTYSAFGQASYTFIDKLTFTAGLRYDRDEKETDYNHNMDTKMGGASLGITPMASYDASESWDAWSPKFIVDYRFNPSVLVYVSAARGFKAGGFAPYFADTPDDAKFDPEYVWSYEAGMNTNWIDNRLILNAAAFYTKAKDLQVHKSTIIGLQSISNAAEATFQGFEVELQARPVSGLDIMASFGYLDTEFDDYEDPFNPAGPQDYKGNKVPYSPEYEVSLAAQYRFPWGLCARAEYLRLGETYYAVANKLKQGAYNLVNAKIGYEREHFDIYFYMNNIFDEEYYNNFMSLPPYTAGMIGDPRTFAVQATVRF